MKVCNEVGKLMKKGMAWLLCLIMMFMVIEPLNVQAEGEQEVESVEMSDYAKVNISLYASNEDAENGQQITVLEDGQSLIFLLEMTEFDNTQLLEKLKAANKLIDFTVDAQFVSMLKGSYPTSLYPSDFDNLAEDESGAPFYRWWIDENHKVRIRFEEEWINKVKNNDNLQLNKIAMGFTGEVNIGDNDNPGKITINVGGQNYIIPIKTRYELTKTVGAPVYRDGTYVADYSVTFTLDQDMGIGGNVSYDGYSADLKLKDVLSGGAGSSLTGQLVDNPEVTGPTDGLSVTVLNNGTENIFSFNGADVLKKGSYTLTYTMSIKNEAAAAKLNGYNNDNVVELLENNASLTTPLTATATLKWDDNISERSKIIKSIIPVNKQTNLYIEGADYYVDYCVAVYLKDEVTTFTVNDVVTAPLEHSDKPVVLLGVNTAEDFWSQEGIADNLQPVAADVVTSISENTQSIIVSTNSLLTLPPGTYYLKVPCKATKAVDEVVKGNSEIEYINSAKLVSVDDTNIVNGKESTVKDKLKPPYPFIKRGAIETSNTGEHVIYDKEGVRGKLIRWDVEFGWSVPDPSMVVKDVMKGGQSLLINGATSFDIWDISSGSPESIVKLWNKNDLDYIDFGTDENGNEMFILYPGKLTADPSASARKFKLTYYTLVPEDTIDFSVMENNWSIEFPTVPSPNVTDIGPQNGTEIPQFGDTVQLKLSKVSTRDSKKYDIHDIISEWKIEIDNPNRIPVDSLSGLVLTDVARLKSKTNISDDMDVWYDFETDKKYAPNLTLVRENDIKVQLVEGEHYTLLNAADNKAKFVINFNMSAIKNLLSEGETYFKKIEVLSYLYNTDYNNPNNGRYPVANIENTASLDYAVSGNPLTPLEAKVESGRAFSTVLKTLEELSGENFADFVNNDNKKEVKWRIEIGAAEFDVGNDVRLKVEDTLPENMKLMEDGENWRDCFSIESTQAHKKIDLTDAIFSWDEDKNQFTLEFTKPGKNWPSKEYNIYIDYYTVFKEGVLQEALDKMPDREVSLTFENVKNVAEVYWNGLLLEEPYEEGDIVINDVVLSKTSEWLESSGSKVKYTIDINPYSLNQSDEDTITLYDYMGTGKENFIYLENTFRVTNKLTGVQMAKGTEPGENTYVLEMAEDGKSFTMTIPDETYIEFVYQVKTTKPVGAEVQLDNTATLAGRTAPPTNVTFTVKSTYQMGSFSVQNDEAGIRLVKIDGSAVEATTPTVLSGAEFKKVELNLDGTAKAGTEEVLTTDANGMIQVVCKLSDTKVYMLEETKAPKGYMLGETPWKWCYVLTTNASQGQNLSEELQEVLDCGITVIPAGSFVDEEVQNNPAVISVQKCDIAGQILEGAEFKLTDANNRVIVPDVNKKGTIQFTSLVPGSYTLEETKAPQGYELRDEYLWKFDITQDGKVQVAQSNNYQLFSVDEEGYTITITNKKIIPTTVTIKGIKELEGRATTNSDKFTFAISAAVDTPNAPLPDSLTTTTRNWSAGKAAFAFPGITFNKVGSYKYEITEEKGTQAGIIYDSSKYLVNVVVKETDDGKLSATVKVGKMSETGNAKEVPDIVFTNQYDAEGQISLVAEKQVNGKMPEEGESFEFILTDEAGIVLQTVENDKGDIRFAPIKYSMQDVGHTFSYTISEVMKEDSVYIMDENKYVVEVSVSDNGTGKLLVKNKITSAGKEQEKIVFNNIKEEVSPEEPTQTFTPAPTEVPTEVPTEAPTEVPTEAPTEVPTEVPTEAPTEVPTEAPTEAPAEVPAESPTPTQIPNLTPVLTPAPIESMSPPPAISEANTGGVRKSPVTGEDDSIYWCLALMLSSGVGFVWNKRRNIKNSDKK